MRSILLALSLTVAAPAAAFAFGGIGCADLPDHDRAVGALEGMTGACDMSVEQARRILAREGAAPAAQAVAPEAAPYPHRRRRHHPVAAY